MHDEYSFVVDYDVIRVGA